MVINRRTAIKHFAIVSAGIALAPSLVSCGSKPSLLFKSISITKEEEELVKALADTIIPKTNTPGAVEVNAHLYAAKMIDDCMAKTDQVKWLKGLRSFAAQAEEKKDAFQAMSKEDRVQFLSPFEEKKITDTDSVFFYESTKYLTVNGYTTSEYYLTQQGFSLIPGRFQGCVAVTTPS